MIFHLNPTGTALWRLLEQPTLFGELAAIFAAAFPGRDAKALASDLSRMISDLAASGLVFIEAR